MSELFNLLFTWIIEFEYKNENNVQIIRSTNKGLDIVITCDTDIQVFLDGEKIPYKQVTYKNKGVKYWNEISKDRISKIEDYIISKTEQP